MKQAIIINFDTVMKQAIKYLGARQLTVYELKGKLYNKKYPYALILEVIAECERLGYLSDVDAIESRLSNLQAKGLGEKRITQALAKAGFKSNLVENVLESTESNYQDVIKELLNRKWKTFMRDQDPHKAKERAIRFLLGRGFDYDQIRDAIEEFLA